MGNLTQFPQIGRRTCDPKHPVLDVLETYWRTLRLGSKAPARSRIDPGVIDSALPWTFMLQTTGEGLARIRVAGQKLHDMFGMDPRGMMLNALFAQQEQERLRTMLQTVTQEPALVALPLTTPAQFLRPSIEATILFLPLCDTGGQVTRILGAIVCTKMDALKGRKFSISTEIPARIESLAATTQMQPRQNNVGPRKAPTLRLVVNNG